MEIFNYNQIDFTYSHTSQADPDPMVDGGWLIPANSTTLSIGADKAYHKQVFDPAIVSWVYVLDETTQPTPAHNWDAKKQAWVLDKAKQTDLQIEQLAQAKKHALTAAVRYADELQAAILGDTSPTAQARLAAKYAAAVAIKNSTASAGDNAVIDAEVQLRTKYTKAQLVDVIIAKGTAAKEAEGLINGMLLLAQDGIEAAQSLEQLAATVAAIKEKSDGLKSQLLAALGG